MPAAVPAAAPTAAPAAERPRRTSVLCGLFAHAHSSSRPPGLSRLSCLWVILFVCPLQFGEKPVNRQASPSLVHPGRPIPSPHSVSSPSQSETREENTHPHPQREREGEREKQTGKRASLSVTVPIPRPSSNPGPRPSLLPANSQPARPASPPVPVSQFRTSTADTATHPSHAFLAQSPHVFNLYPYLQH